MLLQLAVDATALLLLGGHAALVQLAELRFDTVLVPRIHPVSLVVQAAVLFVDDLRSGLIAGFLGVAHGLPGGIRLLTQHLLLGGFVGRRCLQRVELRGHPVVLRAPGLALGLAVFSDVLAPRRDAEFTLFREIAQHLVDARRALEVERPGADSHDAGGGGR